MIDDRDRRRVERICAAGIVIMVTYWTLWFADRAAVRSDTTQAYYDFENAFPLADAWITACLVGTIVTLRRRAPSALFWMLAGGSAGIYLFGMDVLYDIEHGIWWKSGGGVVELAINLITIAVAAGLLRWAWQRRTALLAGTGGIRTDEETPWVR